MLTMKILILALPCVLALPQNVPPPDVITAPFEPVDPGPTIIRPTRPPKPTLDLTRIPPPWVTSVPFPEGPIRGRCERHECLDVVGRGPCLQNCCRETPRRRS
jgi:hypothetical protein